VGQRSGPAGPAGPWSGPAGPARPARDQHKARAPANASGDGEETRKYTKKVSGGGWGGGGKEIVPLFRVIY